jgi:hypothetical protein
MSASTARLNEVTTMVVWMDQNGRRCNEVTELSFKWAEHEFLSLASKSAYIPFNPAWVILVKVRAKTDEGVIVLRNYTMDDIQAYRDRLTGITHIQELD